MPIGDIVYLSAIVVAFVIFSAVLGWAEMRTRQFGG